ncbi:hypothetical protein ABBQ38_013047 [Trebouxia sp. C0009 RCD-2024]
MHLVCVCTMCSPASASRATQTWGSNFAFHSLVDKTEAVLRVVQSRLMRLSDMWNLLSKYRGVRLTGQKTVGSSIAVQGERYHMGTYTTPEEAACVYDEACILLKKEPVNFPKSQYDEATILQIPDFETFVKQKKATGKPKAKTSRYIGVSRNRLGQWVCQANLKGQRKSTQVQMGAFPTEEMAARAYDKLRIYQGLDTSNFPIASYKLRPILKHKTIDSLVASSKAEARALKRTEYSSRYKGVHKLQQVASFPYAAAIRAMNGYDINLGRYETEEQAAMSYDQSCIYQGYKPVNFPDYAYDMHEICRRKDFAEFVQHSREMAARLVKSRQTSRFTGVSWNLRLSKWEAYVFVGPPQNKKICIGYFEDEHKAAQAVDERRKTLGQEPANFPLKSSRTVRPDALWLRSGTSS